MHKIQLPAVAALLIAFSFSVVHAETEEPEWLIAWMRLGDQRSLKVDWRLHGVGWKLESVGFTGDAMDSGLRDRLVRTDGPLYAEFRNGDEIIRVDEIKLEGDDLTIDFSHYDSRLELSLNKNQFALLSGKWLKRRGDLYAEVDFYTNYAPIAFCGTPDPIRPKEVLQRAAGRWSMSFEDSGPAVAVFEVRVQPGESAGQITGTILTPTGDYRYLWGDVFSWIPGGQDKTEQPYFRLYTFDGAHAFMFEARMQDDGTIEGDFWSGNWHHETWTAVRDDDAQLPDAFEQTSVTDEAALEELVFKDIEGTPTRVFDALDDTGAPARVLEIFGTWCPNCADAGRELVSLKTKYGDKLGIVGLAFEVTEDFERSATQVRRHHEHIGSNWAVLIAGLSDKDKATATLGFLDKVRSYPTLVFMDADNEVRAVYSGFSGPATGEAYTKQRECFEVLIEEMIGE